MRSLAMSWTLFQLILLHFISFNSALRFPLQRNRISSENCKVITTNIISKYSVRIKTSLYAQNLTDITKEKLIKTAQLLREEALTLESNLSTEIKNEEFVSKTQTKLLNTTSATLTNNNEIISPFNWTNKSPIRLLEERHNTKISIEDTAEEFFSTAFQDLAEAIRESNKEENVNKSNTMESAVNNIKDIILRSQLKQQIIDNDYNEALDTLRDYLVW